MSFHVGQKVICVNNEPHEGRPWVPGEEVVVGQIYTIRRVHFWRDHPVVWLEEVRRAIGSVAKWGPDCGYGQFRFRPAVERKTDISIFTQILDGVRDKETISN